MKEKKAYWLFYPGDFELYHCMKQNFSRVERGCQWPAFWKSDGFRNRVAFRREYTLALPTVFTVYGVTGSQGYVQVGETKHPLGREISCPEGHYRISVHIACIGCMPSIYVAGDVIRSDPGWLVEDFDTDPVEAAYSRYFTDPGRDPSQWAYSEKMYEPVTVESVNGGVLYGFETELTAALEVVGEGTPTVYLGESRAEALDTQNCYFHCTPDPQTRRCPRQALRYAFLPQCEQEDYRIRAIHQYIDIPVKARFHCDDPELNEIFRVAEHTFMLCSGAFFLDGVKRDKWIWGGDAYQSLFVNRFLTGDRDIEKRTLIALRGNDPVTTHVNTILDYSLLWILSVDEYFETYGDSDFLRWIYPKMESLMELCFQQREEHGFLVGRKRDWVFIDWADFDRHGPLCAEQMLLAECCRVMEKYAQSDKRGAYTAARRELLRNIEDYFWDEEKGAYIDSFTSGKRNVTRHANIFAIVYNIADEDRKRRLVKSVLLNDSIPAITTPYFRFFELEALCRMGCLDAVLQAIKAYWGGMLKLGAVTFWEEFDPNKGADEQYEMYGDPYGKSLCHAWAASPIYLLARYFVGLRPTSTGGKTYAVELKGQYFTHLDCTFPMGEKLVRIRWEDGKLDIV